VEEGLLAWFDEHGRDLPWRETRDPYAILVSEVMLQQTQVARVVPRYLAWLERWPSVDSLAAAAPADAIREWQGLGYNRRALNLHRAAGRIATKGWPEDLTELPGVGRYTAGAIAAFAFDLPVPTVDGNIARVLSRLVNLQKPWRRIRKAAGLDDVRLHDLRHSFASVGAAGGMSLPMIGALLGHSQPQTTHRYAHLAADPLRAASETIASQIAGALLGATSKDALMPGGSSASSEFRIRSRD